MVNDKNKKNEEKYYETCPVNVKTLDCVYYPDVRCIEISESSVEMDKPCVSVRINSYTHKGKTTLCVNYAQWWKDFGF